MTGSIRLHVTAALAEGERRRRNRRAGALSGHCHAPWRRATRCCCSTAATASSAPASRPSGVDRASLCVEHRTRTQTAEPDLWLAFALLKRDATDLVVQKATELGVAALLPVLTERGNTHRMNADRLTAIAIEAAEQCERLTVPDLHAPRPLAALLSDWPPDRRLFAAIEREHRATHRPDTRPARAAGRSRRRLLAGGT